MKWFIYLSKPIYHIQINKNNNHIAKQINKSELWFESSPTAQLFFSTANPGRCHRVSRQLRPGLPSPKPSMEPKNEFFDSHHLFRDRPNSSLSIGSRGLQKIPFFPNFSQSVNICKMNLIELPPMLRKMESFFRLKHICADSSAFKQRNCGPRLRSDGIMDSVLACGAGEPGSIPALSKWFFSRV